MHIDDATLTRIGTDPRWLFSGLKLTRSSSAKDSKTPSQSLLAELLHENLGLEAADAILPQASLLVVTSRQVAIRQHLSTGVQLALSPAKESDNHRAVITKRIQRLLKVGAGHARRVANGLGILSGDKGTDLLVDLYVGGSKQFTRELDVDLIQMLACGSGEHLRSFVQDPFLFFANTACAAIRLRFRTLSGTDIASEKTAVKERFPPIVHTPLPGSQSSNKELTPTMKVAVYGIAMWQQAASILDEDAAKSESQDYGLGTAGKKVSDPFCAKHPKGRFPAKGVGHLFSAQPLDHAKLVHRVATEASWIFPELSQIIGNYFVLASFENKDAIFDIQKQQSERLETASNNPKYQTLVANAVNEVGLEVGKAICGVEPYTRNFNELSHETSR